MGLLCCLFVTFGASACGSGQAARLVMEGQDHLEAGRHDDAITAFDEALEVEPDHVKALGGRAEANIGKESWAEAEADLERLVEISPEDASVWQARGIVHYNNQRLEAARADFERAIELAPSSTRAFYHRARVSVLEGDFESAVEDFETAFDTVPLEAGRELAIFQTDFANALFETGRNAEIVRKQFDLATESDPTYPEPYCHRAMMAMLLGDSELAGRELALGMDQDPENELCALASGVEALHAGQLEDAEEALTELLDRDDVRHAIRAEAHTLRALTRQGLGSFVEGLQDARSAVELAPRDADALAVRGQLQQAQGANRLAMKDFEAALDLAPNNDLALQGRGQLHLEDGQNKDAIADFTRGIENTDNPAMHYFLRGSARIYDEVLVLAAEDLSRAVELDPTLTDAHYLLAIVNSALGDQEGAEAAADKLIEAAPDDPSGYGIRGELRAQAGIEAEDDDLIEAALEDIDKAIALSEGNPADQAEYVIDRGDVFLARELLDQALAEYDVALALAPRSFEVHYSRGLVYFNQERFPQAISAFDKAVEVGPRQPEGYYFRALSYISGDLAEDDDQVDQVLADLGLTIDLDEGGEYAEHAYEILAEFGALDE